MLPDAGLLLVDAGVIGDGAPGTRTGGVPLVPAGFGWPRCRACRGWMQFLVQIALIGGDGTLSVFMCQNRPGRCAEWSATSGGNRAFVFAPGPLRPAWVPNSPAALLGPARGVASVPAADGRPVVGRLGGEPDWLQYDETPHCARCAGPMAFVAQLQEGRPEVNFGMGGRAYAFRCRSCAAAAFLWQR